jgi:hypothetical protein
MMVGAVDSGLLVWTVTAGVIGLTIGLFLFSIPAIQAKRRGYSLIIWFFTVIDLSRDQIN